MTNIVDIGLDTSPRLQGRAPKQVHISLGRELTEADLIALEVERDTKPPTLQKLRETHHQIARLLANGDPPGVVAIKMRYSASRISILQNDPAFQELVASYRDIKNVEYADFHHKAGIFSVETLDELRDRFHDNPDSFTKAELMEVTKLFADRSGNGPSSKSTTVNVNVDLAARIEAGRKRLDALRAAEGGPVCLPSPNDSVIEGDYVALEEPTADGPSSRPPGEPVA